MKIIDTLREDPQTFLRPSQVKLAKRIESVIYPTDAQLDCSKRMLKFSLKFTREVLLHVMVFYNRHQGSTMCALLKLYLLIIR
jgi:hypothetical protein